MNFTEKISRGALLTATRNDGKINTMTVSWGGCGVLWGKRVAFVFVRPTRYTYEFCENGEKMSLSFLGEERKSTLSYCGSKSGKDVDKFKECKLNYKMVDGVCVFDDAKETLVLKKLYSQQMDEACFFDKGLLSFYKENDFHIVYVCEIERVIKNN